MTMKAYPVYLNGEFRTTEDRSPIKNPANGESLGTISRLDRAAVAEAIGHGHRAFAAWREIPGKTRGEWLRKIAEELEKRRDEVARAITRENGKPLSQSQGEVSMSVDHLQWFAEEARRGYGRVLPNQVKGKRNLVIKTPIGVVAAISPWNFPLALAVRKIAPALAAGCPVILKPASYTPISAVLFAECVDSVKLERGVFQLVAGSAPEIAAEFLDNPLCRKITFTGSTEVGRKLIEGAARQIKPLSLELGGHAPVIVFRDCDLKAAVEGTIIAKFRNSGQSCIAANRVYVERAVYPAFLTALTEKVIAMPVGDGLEAQTEIGPLIDEQAMTKALEHVQDAVRGGAGIRCGGKRLERPGNFFAGTVLSDVPRSSLCMHEETFAPIAPVCAFDSEEEVIECANASPFGLSAYVFTRDLGRMFRMAESLEAGMVGINDGLPTSSHAPFGGVKQSGWGRELGTEGMDAFLETKHISIQI